MKKAAAFATVKIMVVWLMDQCSAVAETEVCPSAGASAAFAIVRLTAAAAKSINTAIKILITFVFIALHLLIFSLYTIPKNHCKIKRYKDFVIILMIIC